MTKTKENGQKRKTWVAVIGTAMLLLVVALSFQLYTKTIQIALSCAVLIVAGLYVLAIIKKLEKIYRFTTILVYFGFMILAIVGAVIKSGIFEEISSAQDLVEIIQGFGIAGKLIFILIQFLQVTFVPIPSSIVVAAGMMLYKPWEVMILSCIGLWLGSFLAFFLGKTFGTRLVKWVIGEELLAKYNNFVKGKDKAMLTYMFVFPVFPDDMLCMIAGLTTMSYPSFIVIQLISRPINVAMTVFLMDGLFAIPFSGWGIALWFAIILLFVAAFIFMWKYSQKIERGMMRFISKITGRPIIKDISSLYAEKTVAEQESDSQEESVPIVDLCPEDILATELAEHTDDIHQVIPDSSPLFQLELPMPDEKDNIEKAIQKKDKPLAF